MAGCTSCAERRKARLEGRPTLMRVNEEWWEVISPDGGGHTRYDTRDEAIANRGDGQVRRRVNNRDVPAVYEVRLDGEVLDTKPRAVDAAAIAKVTPGSTVHMVPAPE